jgi:molecular chaperone GrpE
MLDRQNLTDQLLDYLQRSPEPPDYLAAAPDSTAAFDPYQLVAEWVALRQEVKQQNKLTQSAQNLLQEAMKIPPAPGSITPAQNNDEVLWKDILGVLDALDRAIGHSQAQIDKLLLTPATTHEPFYIRALRKLFPALHTSAHGISHGSLVEALVGNQEGIEMIRQSLLALLHQRQITPILALGELFDSSCMYAIAQRPDDSVPRNTVVQEVVRGYRQGDRVLRETQAIVASSG